MPELDKEKIVRAENIAVCFDQVCVLDGLNFALGKGEKISIIGRSGSGKSTFLKILAGLSMPTRGNVKKVSDLKLAYLFQNNSLLPWKTVYDNIKFFSRRDTKDIQKTLESLGILEIKDMIPSQLSGGMLQRANLACCLCCQPDVLLMDEPFSSLDYITKLDNYKFFEKILKDKKISTVLVTHDIKEATLFSEKIFILSKKTKNFKDVLEVAGQKRGAKKFSESDFNIFHDKILNKL